MNTRSLIFWNVQRLFGSQGSPIEFALSSDDDASSASQATIEAKLDVIAATIDLISELSAPPLFIGLVEIESDELCSAIAERVTSANLESVDKLASDRTGFALDGLNVGGLVDKDAIEEVSQISTHVIDRTFNTRDVLEVHLALPGDSQLTVLVNHWPSRLTGEGASRRVSAAHYVKRLVAGRTRYQLRELWDAQSQKLTLPGDDALEKRASSPVVVMGDFNDEPFNESVELLGSSNDWKVVHNDLKVRGTSDRQRFRSYMASEPRLYNPWWDELGERGSYYRSPRWRYYDQILFSRGLLSAMSTVQFQRDSHRVLSADETPELAGNAWALVNRGGKPIPFDRQRNRGCSDHFPVFAQIKLEE
ncbi:MAG: endonuclease/exonuclease/phosphatase family protein [Pseudomonadota bacterium]